MQDGMTEKFLHLNRSLRAGFSWTAKIQKYIFTDTVNRSLRVNSSRTAKTIFVLSRYGMHSYYTVSHTYIVQSNQILYTIYEVPIRRYVDIYIFPCPYGQNIPNYATNTLHYSYRGITDLLKNTVHVHTEYLPKSWPLLYCFKIFCFWHGFYRLGKPCRRLIEVPLTITLQWQNGNRRTRVKRSVLRSRNYLFQLRPRFHIFFFILRK